MDSTRCDSWTRSISSRRVVSGAIASAITSLLGLTPVHEVGAAPCPKGKQRCGRKCIPKRRCCKTTDCRPKGSGKVCKRGRCVCPAGTKRCGKRCLPKAAACPPKPDASCPPGGVSASVTPNFRVAQTFTEPNGGRLIAASIWFCNDSATTTGTYELRVQPVDPATGFPQATILGAVERSANFISNTTLSWVRFDFPVPPRLQPGRQYALVLTLLGTGRWETESRFSAACPGGGLFTAVIPSEFTFVANTNIPYQTFVRA